MTAKDDVEMVDFISNKILSFYVYTKFFKNIDNRYFLSLASTRVFLAFHVLADSFLLKKKPLSWIPATVSSAVVTILPKTISTVDVETVDAAVVCTVCKVRYENRHFGSQNPILFKKHF